ncbi:MAG: hypothetical protein HY735_26905 [Verrucomicrobia bacterium]|nr:hypothetical protein [Verrucomicrobiota bacterium]
MIDGSQAVPKRIRTMNGSRWREEADFVLNHRVRLLTPAATSQRFLERGFDLGLVLD